MKRIILTACAILFASMCFAQKYSDDTTRYLASKLNQNWFVTANASVNWWQGSDRIPAGNFTTLNGPSFGGGVSLGKWITHNIALRMSYNINKGQSFINGRHVNSTSLNFLFNDTIPIPVTQDGQTYNYYRTSFMYHNLHGDVLLSPIDLIQGYYTDRFYTPVLVFGMGVACVSEHPFVLQSLLNKEARNFELSANAGLINRFYINKYLDVNLELMVSGQEWHIDSWYNEYGAAGNATQRPKVADFNYSGSLGFVWYPGGRIYEYPNRYKDAMVQTIETIKVMHDTVYVHDTLIQFSSTFDTISEIVSFPLSIFFHRDSYQLMSRRDVVNLSEIARVALEKGWKIRLRGSCDSATASAEYNQRLSENRCRRIQMELMELGVPEEQMILVPVGGVKELDPTEYDRRVLIELVKELK